MASIYLFWTKKNLFLLLTFFFLLGKIVAQDAEFSDNKEKYQIKIQRTSETILLDGKLEEAVWKTADMATDFWIKIPVVKKGATPKTEVQLTYDDKNIYIGITCYDTDEYIIQTLKRDKNYWDSDAIGVVLDPIGESSNGFMFGVSPLGVQMEALISTSGGGTNWDNNWDNKWYSATHRSLDHWTVEMAIPFKTLRFDSQTEWGVNFIRNNPKDNEYHSWAPVPQQFAGIDLNFGGALLWDAAPPKIKRNFAVIPYLSGGLNHDIENNKKVKGKLNAGVDAKIAVTSSLNLDLTVNPDFSQIEVDQQVTNLTRFSIFLPEKRTFFLENADIFSGFGFPGIRPFFSRTIGLNPNGETVPIFFGARLSGNLGSKTRIGIMNMQTKKDDAQLGQNYFTAAVHRRIGKRSVIRGLVSNRQAYDGKEFSKQDYGRNAGLEFSLSSSSGQWRGWGGFHHSFRDGISKNSNWTGIGGGHFGKNLSAFTDFNKVDKYYYADMGFISRIENYYRDTVIRSAFFQNFTEIEYSIFPENDEVVNIHKFGLEYFVVYDDQGKLNEGFARLRYFMDMKNRSRLRFRLDNRRANLVEELTFTGEDTVKVGKYNTYQFNIQYISDDRKAFNYEVDFKHGGFYHGTLSTYQLSLNYRRQPWGNFSIGLQKNDIRFPDAEGIEFVDLNSRVEINFSKSIFWTTFTQYNFQNNRFNINSRLQYRFSPMSDFFVVYTDNYNVSEGQGLGFLESIKAKNRALVFKLNYWFSL